MTDYIFDNGEIKNNNTVMGWFSEGLALPFDCLVSVRKILVTHKHTLDVQSFRNAYEIVDNNPHIREVEQGYFITCQTGINYAYFSNEMNCAKSCAKAVLDVISA